MTWSKAYQTIPIPDVAAQALKANEIEDFGSVEQALGSLFGTGARHWIVFLCMVGRARFGRTPEFELSSPDGSILAKLHGARR